MSFQPLFIRTQKSIGGIQLDAVISETHNTDITITRNPIELGAKITDNAIVEPKKVTIVADVSDTPLNPLAGTQVIESDGRVGSSTTSNITRSNAAYAAIVELAEKREPIQLQTKLKLYENMLITNINVTQDKDTSRIVSMNITLEEIIIVESKTVFIPPSKTSNPTTAAQASSAEDSGRKEAEVVTEAEEPAKTKSVLKTAKDWVFGE